MDHKTTLLRSSSFPFSISKEKNIKIRKLNYTTKDEKSIQMFDT